MTFAAKFEGFTNHRNGLGSEHVFELGIAQLDDQVIAERELDAVHTFRVILPALLHLGPAFYDEAQRLILPGAPFRANRRLAQLVVRGKRAHTRTHFELDRLLAGIGCARQGGRTERGGCERFKAV